MIVEAKLVSLNRSMTCLVPGLYDFSIDAEIHSPMYECLPVPLGVGVLCSWSSSSSSCGSRISLTCVNSGKALLSEVWKTHD